MLPSSNITQLYKAAHRDYLVVHSTLVILTKSAYQSICDFHKAYTYIKSGIV